MTTKAGKVLIFVLLVFLGCNDNVFEMYSSSMEPTIKEGDIVLADYNFYKSNLSPVHHRF